MSTTYSLTGSLYVDMIRGGAKNLQNNAKIVNDLNVFPIPDGDTGDNMSRTIAGGAACSDTGSLGSTSKVVAEGMLLSARGNSGVILSQFFEGLAKGFANIDCADAKVFANAMKSGVLQAYSSVVKPTEGTILTVMREAADYAADNGIGGTFEDYFNAFREEMHRSLDRTPELLPVLRESGVIDSGGAGFVYIIEGMDRILRGEEIDGGEYSAPSEGGTLNTDAFGVDTEMVYGYCTEVMLQLRSDKTDPDFYDVSELIAYLESIGGDSIVAFKVGTRVKLHVHTFEPEKVLAYCHTLGEFVTLKVENMSIQHSETTIENRYERKEVPKEHKKYGVVAVAQGEGIKEMFTQFGADYIVDGQQTMNPSTEDFIKAFEEVNADNIIVLPNNSNIFLAAKQASELYEKANVRVLESRTIAEGYGALTMLDFTSDDLDTICDELNDAIASVTSGLVTYAVRDSVNSGFVINEGDSLGFIGKELVTVDDTREECACSLLSKVDMTGKEVIIAILGKDAEKEDMDKVRAYIKANFPKVELYEVDGGQDVYSFIFAI